MITASIVIPTYNEANNIGRLIDRIAQVMEDQEFEVIVVDDSSPDGTSDKVKQRDDYNKTVHLIKRKSKLGLASAILAGCQKANGRYIIMMDADFSHRPEEIKAMLGKAAEANIVIGSRYVDGAEVSNCSRIRRCGSLLSVWIAKRILNIDCRDPMSGFALYDKETILGVIKAMNPTGFKFLLEVLVKTKSAKVVEVPIKFDNRTNDESKFGMWEIVQFFLLCLNLYRYKTKHK